MSKYTHKTNGATYTPKKPVEGGVVFHAAGGNKGDYQWMSATVFLTNEQIAQNLEPQK
jgi:hypothetical protein